MLAPHCERLIGLARRLDLVSPAVPDIAVWDTVPVAVHRREIAARLLSLGIGEGNLWKLKLLDHNHDRASVASLLTDLEQIFGIASPHDDSNIVPPFPGFCEVDRTDFRWISAQHQRAIDFVLQEGKPTLIVGRSGSGKTTLLKRIKEQAEQSGRPTVMVEVEQSVRPESWDMPFQRLKAQVGHLELSLDTFKEQRGIFLVDEFQYDVLPYITLKSIQDLGVQAVYATFDFDRQLELQAAKLDEKTTMFDITPDLSDITRILMGLSTYAGETHIEEAAATLLAGVIHSWGGVTREVLRFADWLSFLTLPRAVSVDDVASVLRPDTWHELAGHIFASERVEMNPDAIANFVAEALREIRLKPRSLVAPPLWIAGKARHRIHVQRRQG